MGEIGISEERGGSGIPIESDSGSTHSGGGAGIYQQPVYVAVGSERVSLRNNAWAKVQGLQDAQLETELVAQLRPNPRFRLKLQLNTGEIAGADDCFDPFEGCVNEDSDLLDPSRQARNDLGDLLVT
jgi:hypothetical protein